MANRKITQRGARASKTGPFKAEDIAAATATAAKFSTQLASMLQAVPTDDGSENGDGSDTESDAVPLE